MEQLQAYLRVQKKILRYGNFAVKIGGNSAQSMRMMKMKNENAMLGKRGQSSA